MKFCNILSTYGIHLSENTLGTSAVKAHREFQLLPRTIQNCLHTLFFKLFIKLLHFIKISKSHHRMYLHWLEFLITSLMCTFKKTFKTLAFIVMYHSSTESGQMTEHPHANKVTPEFPSMIKSLKSWRRFVTLYSFSWLSVIYTILILWFHKEG